jgi:hypothetical protein
MPALAGPSQNFLQRPAGDRVKTDAKDALLLARLLRQDRGPAAATRSHGAHSRTRRGRVLATASHACSWR